MFKANTASSALTKPHGVNISAGVQGRAVKLVYGMTMSSPDLVWYNNWQANNNPVNPGLWQVVNSQNKTKKSSKSGVKYYSASVDFVVGHAPNHTILQGWYNNQKLGCVYSTVSGFISNGQFQFTVTASNSSYNLVTTIPSTGPYQISTGGTFVSDLNDVVIYPGTGSQQALQPAAYPPGALQYSVSTTGVYTFNVAQAGNPVSIWYRITGGSNPATMAGIYAVTIAEQYSAVFNDYGAGQTQYVWGTWDRPLWLAKWAVPGRIDTGAYTARAPYCWWWDGDISNPNVTIFTDPALEGKPITVHYSTPAIYKSDGTFANTTDSPLQLLNLEWELQFADGGEYVAQPTQQLIQPWINGLGSVSFDLGVSNSVPNLNFEVVGMFTSWFNGDCDVADVITDLVCSGPVVVQPNGNPWNYSSGTSGGNLSGTVTDQNTGAAIVGATVSIGALGLTTTTDGSGNYSFSSIAQGSYSVIFSATGYYLLGQSVSVGSSSTFSCQLVPISGSWSHLNLQDAVWTQSQAGGGAHGTYTFTGGTGGSAAVITVNPASPHDNYRFSYLVAPPPGSAQSSFTYTVTYTVPVGNLAKIQALEFFCNQSDGYYTYYMAWKADIAGTGFYQYYVPSSSTNGTWVTTTIPVSITEGTAVTIAMNYAQSRTAGNIIAATVTIGSTVYTENIPIAAIQTGTATSLYAGVQLNTLQNYQSFTLDVIAGVAWSS